MGTADIAAFEARAGAAIVRGLANAQALVLDHAFNVVQTPALQLPGLDGLMAQSRLVEVVALRTDVDAAPVDLVDGATIAIGGVAHRITRRVDHDALGQVTFVLDPQA